jgi:hypothetical protein
LDSETENPNSSPSIIVFAENDVEPLGSIRRFSILKSIATSTAQFCPFFNSRQSAIAAEVEKATTRQAIANRVFIIGQQVVIWPGWWGLIQIFPVWFSERPGGSCARDLIVWKCLSPTSATGAFKKRKLLIHRSDLQKVGTTTTS